MRIAAMTMVYRDHWALSRWFAHHAAELGAENLFVVVHGPDPEVARICPGANIWTVPRAKLDHFDKQRAEMLDGFHVGLSKVYDWVIRTDADELICVDPDIWESLPAALAAQDSPVVTALGFDLVEQPGEAALGAEAVFGPRRGCAFSGHYSKAVAARRPVSFQLHGVKVAPRRLGGFPFNMPRGLFLAHIKYANRAVLDAGNAVRMAVANGPGKGLPGGGWRAADDDASKFYATFAEKPVWEWEAAESRAWEVLSVKPARIEKSSLVKARALKMPFRTELPARFFGKG